MRRAGRAYPTGSDATAAGLRLPLLEDISRKKFTISSAQNISINQLVTSVHSLDTKKQFKVKFLLKEIFTLSSRIFRINATNRTTDVDVFSDNIRRCAIVTITQQN